MKEKCFELKEVHDPKSKNMTLTTGAGIKIFIDFKNEIIETIKNGEVIKKATFNEIGSLTNFCKLHCINAKRNLCIMIQRQFGSLQ